MTPNKIKTFLGERLVTSKLLVATTSTTMGVSKEEFILAVSSNKNWTFNSKLNQYSIKIGDKTLQATIVNEKTLETQFNIQ